MASLYTTDQDTVEDNPFQASLSVLETAQTARQGLYQPILDKFGRAILDSLEEAFSSQTWQYQPMPDLSAAELRVLQANAPDDDAVQTSVRPDTADLVEPVFQHEADLLPAWAYDRPDLPQHFCALVEMLRAWDEDEANVDKMVQYPAWQAPAQGALMIPGTNDVLFMADDGVHSAAARARQMARSLNLTTPTQQEQGVAEETERLRHASMY